MIYQYISRYKICNPFLCNKWVDNIDWQITASLVITFVFFMVLCFGYPAGKYSFSPESLQEVNGKIKKGAFIDRYQERNKT
jgi:hypothetical protein